MISQISSVSFLVYTLLCIESWSTDSWGVVQKLGSVTVLGVLGGCKNISVCNANANSPEAAKFQNSIFLTFQMPHLHSAAQGACPLHPLPAATEFRGHSRPGCAPPHKKYGVWLRR